VLVLGKDDVIEQRVVKIGQRNGSMRVVESGLDPADWVVMAGIQRAVPDMKVTPEKITIEAAATGDPSGSKVP
jgi:multidrug efflux pump subunit AcrA (membrane-fusion protein)